MVQHGPNRLLNINNHQLSGDNEISLVRLKMN
jgi:hypothetical protein